MTDSKNETHYYDPATGERVTAMFTVFVVVPTNYVGQIEVEAQSEQEAVRMALAKAGDIDWEAPRSRFYPGEIEILDIECADPPIGAPLIRPGSSEADISSLFEDAPLRKHLDQSLLKIRTALKREGATNAIRT